MVIHNITVHYHARFIHRQANTTKLSWLHFLPQQILNVVHVHNTHTIKRLDPIYPVGILHE